MIRYIFPYVYLLSLNNLLTKQIIQRIEEVGDIDAVGVQEFTDLFTKTI